MEFIEQHNWHPSKIDVTGVNVCACVSKTVSQLSNVLSSKNEKTILSLKRKNLGCYECNESDCASTLSSLSKQDNIKIKDKKIAKKLATLILYKKYMEATNFINSSSWILKRIPIKNYIVSKILKQKTTEKTKKEQLNFLFNHPLGITPHDVFNFQSSLINLAIKTGASSKMVIFFLKKGVPIERIPPSGASPLQNAVERYRYDIIEILLKNGANINAVRDNNSVIDDLVMRYDFSLKDAEMLQYLLLHGAKITDQTLMLAKKFNRKTAIAILEKTLSR